MNIRSSSRSFHHFSTICFIVNVWSIVKRSGLNPHCYSPIISSVYVYKRYLGPLFSSSYNAVCFLFVELVQLNLFPVTWHCFFLPNALNNLVGAPVKCFSPLLWTLGGTLSLPMTLLFLNFSYVGCLMYL